MRRVLIIEDDEEQAAMAMRLFRVEGARMSVELGDSTYHIVSTVAGTLDEGLERDKAIDFDCIVIDAGLPDVSSPYDTLARSRDFRAPLVFWTASDDRKFCRAVRETGAAFVSKPGEKLLLEKVWSQIQYRRGAEDSEAGQMGAQQRIQESSIKESTPVIMGLGRWLTIVGAIIVGTFTITSVVLNKVGAVDSNLSAVRVDLATYSAVTNKRQDASDAAAKEERAETSKVRQEWRRWRYGVSHDIKRLGEKTQVPTETNPDNDP